MVLACSAHDTANNDKREFGDEINCAEHMWRCDATLHIAIMSCMLWPCACFSRDFGPTDKFGKRTQHP